ncbi:UDP-2,4-diacetamido-2,4,6-trideoxy-beta-L-altropyranose hydrolase [Ponticoccus alexandrii]|uniref:UDP-2,4-diacetamido-2,4, 6-trideoxy-beta-L-altropyranose hydrolase n=1 Tax=Ponticoccus alexandrii TaxID=1943633 RepID=A0ABX7FDF8_9RHOB|nr:UDP-2,4-diacetamido-2,4,6-trideoxy-beta-L-altropyranose hydrolase [Ponticoccus alexandrii]ETA50653.2 hypothetical protein P279_18395 [Rhodobacteraceae bacterium PD-2]QRF68625.1 UDP-2,4-diacetamido-2,4,6-trideoxy-beta-L-altropyranose hydrolase [Ponticoccus alexandrii]
MEAEPRQVVFRTDAGQRIGTGHVMRCLSIADRLIAQAAEKNEALQVHFICKAHIGHMAEQIAARGHRCTLLPAEAEWKGEGYLGWLGGPLEQDATLTLNAVLAAGRADLLVVDHYALGAAWQSRMRGANCPIAAIDDLSRSHDCDILIDQNIGHTADFYAGRVPEGIPVLAGAQFAPVRGTFAQLRPASLARRADLDVPRVLLVSLGGADPDDVTSAVLRALRPPLVFDEVHVVLSGIARHLEAVRAEAKRHDNVTLHVDTRDMPALMARADLSIGAAGVTAIERCVLGLPTLMVVVADNQVEAAQRMADLGAVRLLGDTAHITDDSVHEALGVFLHDTPSPLKPMSAAAADLCDGRGLDRIAPALFDIMSSRGRSKPISQKE